jgi:hypothetical protein
VGQSTLGVLSLVIGVAGALLAFIAHPPAIKLAGVALLLVGVLIVGAVALQTPTSHQTPIIPIAPAGFGSDATTGPPASPGYSPPNIPIVAHTTTPPPTPTHTPAPGPTGH